MKQGATVLMTGASGFIGRRTLPALERSGFTVQVERARLDREDLSCPRSDVVVHLAGMTYVPDSWKSPLRYYETNVVGTLRVLEYCARHHARMVYVSSYVYGAPDSLPISENAMRRPANPYMHTKVVAEDCCEFFGEQMGVDVVVIRPFNVYGPDQDKRFVIPAMISQLLDPAVSVVSVGSLQPRRDFLFVDDLVELLISAAASDAVGVFNAGSGQSRSIQEVFDLLKAVTGVEKPVASSVETRRGEIMDIVADVDLSRRVFDWEATTSFRDGLTATVTAMSRE